MASAFFNEAMNDFGKADIDLLVDDIRVMLVKSAYAFDVTDTSLTDVGAGNDNGRSGALAAKTVSGGGIFDSDDTTITATAAVACNALIYFKHTGVDATARPIAYIDTVASGLPFTPSASQVVPIVHDNGANKIFKL